MRCEIRIPDVGMGKYVRVVMELPEDTTWEWGPWEGGLWGPGEAELDTILLSLGETVMDLHADSDEPRWEVKEGK